MKTNATLEESRTRKDRTEQAYDHLIDLLITHQVQPGDLIDPRRIADSLGISMSPVARALQQLAREGFVKILPRKGSFVENGNPRSILEQMTMREALECQAARIYCGKTVSENLDTLLEIAKRIEDTPVSFEEHWQLEIEFHTFLISLAGFPSLVRSFQSTMKLGFFLRLNLFFREMTNPQCHIELANALVTEDPDRAEALIRRHLRSGKPAVLHEIAIVSAKEWDDI